MAFDSSSLDDYVDVPARIREFYERYPEGSIRPANREQPYKIERLPTPNGDQLFVVYTALAFRTPDDPEPGQGTAWEQFPGRTAFTRNSELMNAETSAWGRALGSLGIGVSGKIASREEVRNRQAERDTEQPTPKSRTARTDDTGRGARSAQDIYTEALKATDSKQVVKLAEEAQSSGVIAHVANPGDREPVKLGAALWNLKTQLEATAS
jgi:hypothetical protein